MGDGAGEQSGREAAVFWGLVASLLSSEHLLLASLSVDPVFSYSSACSMAEHTAEFWQPVDWLLWVTGPPRSRQLVWGGGPFRASGRTDVEKQSHIFYSRDACGRRRVEPRRME